MNKYIKSLLFVVIFLVSFFVGFCVKEAIYSAEEKELRKQMHPAMQTHMWLNRDKDLAVYSKPIDKDSYIAELSVYVENQTNTLPRAENETWHSFVVVPDANIIFALVKKKVALKTSEFEKLVKINLPKTKEDLETLEVKTLFTAEDLRFKKGKSRITEISGFTSDGDLLLLSLMQSDPEISWKIKKVIYSVEDRSFRDLVFETDG